MPEGERWRRWWDDLGEADRRRLRTAAACGGLLPQTYRTSLQAAGLRAPAARWDTGPGDTWCIPDALWLVMGTASGTGR